MTAQPASTLHLADPAATAQLGRALAPHLAAGDTVTLSGGLGAGKSHLARALIEARLKVAGRSESVPSPSYTLVQVYDLDGVQLWHADLYRLSGVDELAELGLDEAFATAICLVEWPDRLGRALPARNLAIALDFAEGPDDTRRATIRATGDWPWLNDALAGAGLPRG